MLLGDASEKAIQCPPHGVETHRLRTAILEGHTWKNTQPCSLCTVGKTEVLQVEDVFLGYNSKPNLRVKKLNLCGN